MMEEKKRKGERVDSNLGAEIKGGEDLLRSGCPWPVYSASPLQFQFLVSSDTTAG